MSFDAKKLRHAILSKLREGKNGLEFDKRGCIFVQATIEVAADIDDDSHAQAALQEMTRIMIGIADGAPVASEQLREMLKGSKAAMLRLAQFKTRPERRFNGFTDTKKITQAPQFNSKAAKGVSLKDLLPPGQGRGPARRKPSLPANRQGR